VVRDQTSVTKFIVGSRLFQFEAQVDKGIYHSFMFDDDRKVDTIGLTDLRSSGVFRNKVLSESSLRDRGFFSLTSLPVGGQQNFIGITPSWFQDQRHQAFFPNTKKHFLKGPEQNTMASHHKGVSTNLTK
jgi:hypothetical protein